MSQFLQTKIHKKDGQEEKTICFQLESIDYQIQLEQINQFIETNGIGPFTKIVPMTQSGEILEDRSFPLKIKK